MMDVALKTKNGRKHETKKEARAEQHVVQRRVVVLRDGANEGMSRNTTGTQGIHSGRVPQIQLWKRGCSPANTLGQAENNWHFTCPVPRGAWHWRRGHPSVARRTLECAVKPELLCVFWTSIAGSALATIENNRILRTGHDASHGNNALERASASGGHELAPSLFLPVAFWAAGRPQHRVRETDE